MSLNINSEIIESYLKDGNLNNVKNHWIYKTITSGDYKVEEPQNICLKDFKKLFEETKKELINFKPLNRNLWIKIFGPTPIPNNISVYLIVGAPPGYEAIVRKNNEGNRYIIIDLAQIFTYSSDIEQLDDIILDFVTHEVAHALISLKYPYHENLTKRQLLKQITFDEGIAHFLSYQEHVLKIDWETEVMKQRKHFVYEKLNYYLTHIDEFSMSCLKKANSGPFWEKFASIAGMFAMVEYAQNGGTLETLLSDGPEVIIEHIIKNNHNFKPI